MLALTEIYNHGLDHALQAHTVVLESGYLSSRSTSSVKMTVVPN